MFVLKTPEEIRKMEKAGRVVARVLEEIGRSIRPGISTMDIDRIATRILSEMHATPSYLHYGNPPYPAATCVSVDSEVVHGIPSETRVLREGSIVSVDFGACVDGWHGDAARTFMVGEVTDRTKQLVADTEMCFWKGFEAAVVGNRIGDISHAVQTYAEERGYGVVRELIGHGIGRHLHEDPDVPNYGRPGRGARLIEGMVIAIEPMINLGSANVLTLEDGWTVETADGLPSAHYENTVAITAAGPVLLTLPGGRGPVRT